MASITTRPNGHRWILFTAPNGKRYTIRLGNASRQQADSAKLRIEALIAAKLLNQPPDIETVKWLTATGAKFYDRLATAGLVVTRKVRTVADLVAWSVVELKKKKSKPATIRNVQISGDNLIKFFKDKPRICDITEDDATDFREWLSKCGGQNGKPLARTTVSRRCRRAREIFALAAKESRRWIAANPFGSMRHWSEVNLDRNVYIERSDIDCVIDELTDVYLRLIVALARYAGLRSPSEVVSLTWQNIDWAKGTMTVECVKTAAYEEKAWRIVPIFPELRPHLEAAYDQLPERGGIFVLPSYQGKPWTTIARRIEAACRRLGMAMWTKPFVNMRASCEYDWLQSHPINVVASWMGHSPQVALLHYNRVAKELTAREVAKSLPAAAPIAGEAKGEGPLQCESHSHVPSRTEMHGNKSINVRRSPR
jgi:hypothetical protein